MSIDPDIAQQTRQCFRNIQQALQEAGSDLSLVLRVRYILPEKSNFAACAPVIKEYMGHVRPAATMIEAGLLNEDMKIEIEVTALQTSS